MRFDRDSTGAIEVSKLKSKLPATTFIDATSDFDFTSTSNLTTVRNQMIQDGFGDNTKIYLVMPGVDSKLSLHNTCGSTTQFAPTLDLNQLGALTAIINVSNACASNSTTRSFGVAESQAPVITHELFHALGAVLSCAPNKDSPFTGHVTAANDPQDLMTPNYHLGPFTLDADNADYYGHNRTDCWDTAKSPFLTAP
jgi:hypothetical protein